jgi:hypothetical protein
MRIRVTLKVVLKSRVDNWHTCKGKGLNNRYRNRGNRPCDSVRIGESELAVRGVCEGC